MLMQRSHLSRTSRRRVVPWRDILSFTLVPSSNASQARRHFLLCCNGCWSVRRHSCVWNRAFGRVRYYGSKTWASADFDIYRKAGLHGWQWIVCFHRSSLLFLISHRVVPHRRFRCVIIFCRHKPEHPDIYQQLLS
jgi:hypothetical protein